jgi:hypothetical protein
MTEKPNSNLESIFALNQLLEDSFLCKEPKFSKDESLVNIMENHVILIKILKAEKKREGVSVAGPYFSGFQLTTDGFILAPYSNATIFEIDFPEKTKEGETLYCEWNKDKSSRYCIRTISEHMFVLDTSFCIINPSYNLALFKAKTPFKSMPSKFNVVQRDLFRGDYIHLSGFNRKVFQNMPGEIVMDCIEVQQIYPSLPILKNIFLTNFLGLEDFLGCIYNTKEGEFAGFHVFFELHEKEKKYDIHAGIKTKNIARFLEDSVSILSEREDKKSWN